jgi:hypothetical protein
MIYRTYGDLCQQVEAELDTQDEEFVSPAEMRAYFNSAASTMEATIVKLGLREKYFQTEAFITLVPGQGDYDLPSDILINKIRKIVYRNQSRIYTMRPLRSESSYAFADVANGRCSGEAEYYTLYKTGNIQKLRLWPVPRIAITNGLRVVYFKSVNRYTQDSDICDLPDICYEFLLSYVRYRVYAKESAGAPNTQDEKANMGLYLTLVQETMQNQIADPDIDEIDQDMSHYEEMI